jgi:TonB-linked SusC/RagA family outer membrane protein
MQTNYCGKWCSSLPFAQMLRIMKLLTVLMLAGLLQVSATGYAQKVTLDLRDVPLLKVFREIRKQTGINFFYKSQVLKQVGKVSVKVNNADVNEVLSQCLANQPVSFRIQNETIILSEKPVARNPMSGEQVVADIEITGTISDDTGRPMAGASVNLKGSDRGTTTNEAGQFRLMIPDKGGVLVISFVGFETTEVRVSKAGNINLSLKVRAQVANEIVVIGYGSQRKQEVTTAVTQISGQEILESKSVTVSNALSGKVPGLIINQRNSRPGSDGAAYSVRGISTYQNNAALIVVDGVANRDGIDRIDPNDIETITVLKDASAAIYGAQSANGVILITTKRGKTGKPKVTYSFNHGFVSPVRLLKMSDAATYARKVNDLALQAGQTLPFTPQAIADFESGKSPSTDWLDVVYRDYFNQDRHSLTLSGGNENVKYFLSGGLTSQGSILTNDNISKYRQYNIRSNVDVQVNKALSIGLDFSARRQNTNYTYLDENTLYQAGVLTIPTIAATVDGFPARGRANNNPLAVVQGPAYDKTQFNLINGTFRFEYKIPKVTGLSIDGFGAVDYAQSLRVRWQQPHYFYEKNAGGVLQRLPNNTATSLTEIYSQSNSYTLHAKLKYNRSFNLHAITAFVAAERNETRSDNLQAGRTGYISPQIDQLFAGGASTQTNTGTAFEGARLNYFGRAGYTYNNKYLVQFQFRYDGSQIFPADKRFGFFPGVSAGWVLSEENFMKGVQFLNNLKLRASYGLLGNDRITQFQYLNLYTLSSGDGNGYVINGNIINVLNPGVAANPNVTWEKKKTLDIGLEGRLFNNKLSFEVDYFRMRTEDILSRRNVSVPTYTGLNSSNLPDENIGIVQNNGVDGSVNYRGNITRDITFNVGANITYAKNKIVYNDEGTTVPQPYQKAEGKPVNALLLYQFKGIYRTQQDLDNNPGLNGVKRLGDAFYQDMNKDGVINSDDRVRADLSTTPQLQYGFVFGAQYKGFDFSGNFMGQARAIVQYDYIIAAGNNTPEYYVKNAWSPSNTSGSLPRIGRSLPQQGEGSTLNTRSVSFLRLKNIELGYTIPAVVLQRAGIQGVRVYVNAYNLLTFDKLRKNGLQDPEETNPQGWQFPQTKSVNIGININL